MPRKTPRRDLDRFLGQLAATGNFALAAERAALTKSGLHKRRARDPAFAARCEAALAAFRAPHPFRGGEEERKGARESNTFAGTRCDEGAGESVGASRNQPLLTQPGDLILSPAGRRRPTQIRRSPAGRLTEAGLAQFLRTLAATANVRLAAHGVGVAPSSIYKRRNADTAFAREMAAALDIATAILECALIEAAEAAFDPQAEPEWLDGGQARLPKMSVMEAFWLLRMHKHSAARSKSTHPELGLSRARRGVEGRPHRSRREMSDDEVTEALIKSLAALGKRVRDGEE